MRTIRPLLLLFSVVLVAANGCGAQAPDSAPSPESAPSSGTAAELERLRALGYVDYSSETAEPGRSGVTVNNAERAYPGYNLYPIRPMGRAELVDNDGNLVHAWFEDEERPWRRVVMLDDGDLLVVGGIWADTYVLRLDWNSEVVWRIPLRAHHDIGLTPDGKYVTLTMDERTIPAVDESVQVRDSFVGIFDPPQPSSEVRSLYDAILASPDLLRIQPFRETKRVIDLIHANSVRFMTRPSLESRHPLYRLGNLLVCMRNQDAIAVLDRDEQKLVWAWGRGELEAPHDATVLESGNILVFDNGTRRNWSRVIEIDPLRGEIVWQYRSPDPGEFFTEARGSAQRLPNGNTLIAESDEGRGFEVTPEGEIVWEYYQPHTDDEGHRAVIIRFYRYEAAVVDPLLEKYGDPRR